MYIAVFTIMEKVHWFFLLLTKIHVNQNFVQLAAAYRHCYFTSKLNILRQTVSKICKPIWLSNPLNFWKWFFIFFFVKEDINVHYFITWSYDITDLCLWLWSKVWNTTTWLMIILPFSCYTCMSNFSRVLLRFASLYLAELSYIRCSLREESRPPSFRLLWLSCFVCTMAICRVDISLAMPSIQRIGLYSPTLWQVRQPAFYLINSLKPSDT